MRPSFAVRFVTAAGALLAANAAWTSARAQQAIPPSVREVLAPASLTGSVTDESGAPAPRVEVVVGGHVAARTDATGHFAVRGFANGHYTVEFRRLGLEPTTFEWDAVAPQETQLAIHLYTSPTRLDRVEVIDTLHDMTGAKTGSIVAHLVDENGAPVDGAEVRLLGSARVAVTDEKGDARFPFVTEGDFVLRARRLGYALQTIPVRMAGATQHDLSFKMHLLPNTLTPVEIRVRGGFDASELAAEEFDRRQRQRPATATFLSSDDLQKFGRSGIDVALGFVPRAQGQALAARAVGGHAYAPNSINARNTTTRVRIAAPKNECVLVNGLAPQHISLEAFGSSQVDHLEVYPADADDVTGTIRDHMQAIPACAEEAGTHPAWYVVFLKPPPEP